jgi:uncharacterized membrane protein YoaK (UPF0700 family)
VILAKDKEDSERMWHEHRMRGGIFRLWLGILLFVIGVGWLGNDLGWWSFNIPWAPIVLVLFAISLILGWTWRQIADYAKN